MYSSLRHFTHFYLPPVLLPQMTVMDNKLTNWLGLPFC